MLVLGFPAFALLCAAVVVSRYNRTRARVLFAAAVVFAAVPFVLYAWYLSRWVSGFGDPQPAIGWYPGLVAFLASALVFAVVITGIAGAYVSSAPVTVSLAPIAIGATYWLFSLRSLH